MKRRPGPPVVGLLLALLLVLAGASSEAQTVPSVRPGAPGEPSRPVAEAEGTPAPRYTEADVTLTGTTIGRDEALHDTEADVTVTGTTIGRDEADR